MTIDLSPILTPLIEAAGLVVTVIVGWAVKRLATKLGVEANSAALANVDAAAMKAIAAGVMATQDQIKAKGYDHADVQNAIAASAVTALVSESKQALTDFGIDPSTDAGKASIAALVERTLPDGVAAAAASPTTPEVKTPTPTLAIKAVS